MRISGVTLTGGDVSGRGGAIRNREKLTITDSTISGNHANLVGGGISMIGSANVTGSTISGNIASTKGGGIYASGAVTVTGSTISGNTASKEGGGIFASGAVSVTGSTISSNTASTFGGGIYAIGAVTATGSTISGNSATFAGGGIYSELATAILTNSIVAANIVDNADEETPDLKGGTFNVTGGLYTGPNPLLGPLANNGGPTFTHALLPGSPALNAGIQQLPVSLFRFDETSGTTASDVVGSNNGTINGDVSLSQLSPLQIGTAIQFDGNARDYIELSQPLTIGSSSSTVEAWVRVPKVDTSGLNTGERVGIILGNFGETPNSSWEIHATGQLYTWWNNGEVQIQGSTDLRDDKWHHVVFVRDTMAGANGELRMYVDGEQETLFSSFGDGAGSDITFTEPHRIGVDYRGGTPVPFHGSMDELAIHDRALSEAEILQRALTNSSLLQDFDQRGVGFSRLQLGQVDLGAYELQASLPPLGLLVSTDSDDVDGDFSPAELSLREAILLANDLPGPDTITFSSLFDTAQTIDLDRQLPTITDALTITGPGADLLTIDAGDGTDGQPGNFDGFRHLNIDDGTATQIEVTISGITLTGGDIDGNNLVGRGGAIRNAERLTVSNSKLIGNASDHYGGAIFNRGDLTLTGSTVSGNTSESRGGASTITMTPWQPSARARSPATRAVMEAD